MIAEFMHFYSSYDLKKVLDLCAVSFYSLYNNMFRIKGLDIIENVSTYASANAGGDALSSYVEYAKKQSKGMNFYLDQVNLLRKIRGNKK